MKITRDEVHDRINTLLGKRVVFRFFGHLYLPFDKNTKNVMVLDKFPLHMFLTKNGPESLTRINLKLLVDVHNIQETYGEMFDIGDTLIYPYQKPAFKEDDMSLKNHRDGNALEILPRTRTYEETRILHKAVRWTKNKGGRIIYPSTHIHIDAMLDRWATRR